MSQPAISVILPVYNGERYLRYAIESVLGQTFKDYELIVVDDGSVDSTPAIVGEYGDLLKYVRQENTGVAGAFNYGIGLASGRYISWLSHDDVFLPDKLGKQFKVLEESSEPAACYTDIQIIDSSGEATDEHHLPEFHRSETLRQIITGGPLCMASYSIMYDRRCVNEVGYYSQRWRYLQDADMLSRLASRFRLLHVPEILMQVREHQDRGIYSANWGREAVAFYRNQLKTYSLGQLFASEQSEREKSLAYQWLGDRMCALPFPVYTVALSQYGQAFRQDPTGALRLLRKAQWVLRRYLRDYLTARF